MTSNTNLACHTADRPRDTVTFAGIDCAVLLFDSTFSSTHLSADSHQLAISSFDLYFIERARRWPVKNLAGL